jgi:DNA-binding CsgD family transcriptional regulator
MARDFEHKDILVLARAGRQAMAVVQRRACPEELLETLRDVVPFEAAHLSYCDPLNGEHAALASVGYAEETLAYLIGPYVETCPAYRIGRRGGRPLRMRDIPFDFYRTETYELALRPAGYEEGVTVCLYTHEGRYTGMLTMSTTTREHPTDRACQILDALRATLADVTDAALTPAWLSSVLEPGRPAVGVTEDGGVLHISLEPSEAFLYAPTAIVRAAQQLLSSLRSRAGYQLRDARGDWHAVQIVRAPAGMIGGRPCAIVTSARSDAPPYGLTTREMDVLTMMATGAHNREIADSLCTSPRTVSTHVEHILAKLQCTSRTAATARAVEEGILRLDA